MKTACAYVLLRGGSKGIKSKNIVDLGGKPLCFYALDALDAVSEIERIVVSTDSGLIRDVVIGHPSKKIELINRPVELASDGASSDDALAHAMGVIPSDFYVFVQATSPLLRSETIGAALEMAIQNNQKVMTAYRTHSFIWSANGVLPLVLDHIAHRPNRQEFDGVCIENGACYSGPTDDFLRTGSRIGENMGVVEMHQQESLEIDSMADLEWASRVLNAS